jgi:hypothetical protein
MSHPPSDPSDPSDTPTDDLEASEVTDALFEMYWRSTLHGWPYSDCED